MDLTDRTIEDVLVDLLGRGNQWLIMLCCVVVGFVAGVLLTAVYFNKIRQYNLKNELTATKDALAKAEEECKEYKEKYEAEKVRAKSARDMEYAQLALSPDAVPLTLDSDD